MREFGEIGADVETVAGAVLAGQLDFEATVIDERLDLIDNGVGRKAVKATFDKMRAAERAGVEAAFFDVHNADKRRLAKRHAACHSGAPRNLCGINSGDRIYGPYRVAPG